MEYDIDDPRYFEIENTEKFFGRAEKDLSKLTGRKIKLYSDKKGKSQTDYLFSLASTNHHPEKKIKEILEHGASVVHGGILRNKPKKDHPLGSFHGVTSFRDTYKFALHHAQWGPLLNIYDATAYTLSEHAPNQFDPINLENSAEGLIACIYVPIDEKVIPPRLYNMISKHIAL